MKRYKNQNLLDFIITNYGDIDYIQQFIKDNDVNINGNLKDNYSVTNVTNNVLSKYFNDNYIVVTGDTIKKFGDFNNDFNNDYS